MIVTERAATDNLASDPAEAGSRAGAEFEARTKHLRAALKSAEATTRHIWEMLAEARRDEDMAHDILNAHLKGIPPGLVREYAERETARVVAELARIETRSHTQIAEQAIEHARRLVEAACVSATTK